MRYAVTGARVVTDEIADLVGAGIPPMDAVKSATAVAADCIGARERTGAIRRGLEADMIVVDRDPLKDIRALRNPAVVINDGRVVVKR